MPSSKIQYTSLDPQVMSEVAQEETSQEIKSSINTINTNVSSVKNTLDTVNTNVENINIDLSACKQYVSYGGNTVLQSIISNEISKSVSKNTAWNINIVFGGICGQFTINCTFKNSAGSMYYGVTGGGANVWDGLNGTTSYKTYNTTVTVNPGTVITLKLHSI